MDLRSVFTDMLTEMCTSHPPDKIGDEQDGQNEPQAPQAEIKPDLTVPPSFQVSDIPDAIPSYLYSTRVVPGFVS